MLPGNVLSNPALPGAFLPPKTNVIKQSLIDYCQGGIAINDASQGLEYQFWTITAVGKNIIYTGQTTGVSTVVYTDSENILWAAGTFDQSMRATYTWVTESGGYYHWYDTTIPGFTTTALPTGVTRPFMVLDDTRVTQLNNSDVILSYLNAGNLYYRQQRDRYGTEYALGAAPAKFLVQAGITTTLRFQFEFLNQII